MTTPLALWQSFGGRGGQNRPIEPQNGLRDRGSEGDCLFVTSGLTSHQDVCCGAGAMGMAGGAGSTRAAYPSVAYAAASRQNAARLWVLAGCMARRMLCERVSGLVTFGSQPNRKSMCHTCCCGDHRRHGYRDGLAHCVGIDATVQRQQKGGASHDGAGPSCTGTSWG